jgi:hypothetical protein
MAESKRKMMKTNRIKGSCRVPGRTFTVEVDGLSLAVTHREGINMMDDVELS